jgi:hypothetical protein
VRRRQLLEKGANLILFGPPGGGISHLAAAIRLALIEKGWRVLFTRTSDLVQKLQVARRELALESAIAKLDKYQLLILDDLAYVTKDQAETSVRFELISARYERPSTLITANQPFREWNGVFPDPAMTLAAVDRPRPPRHDLRDERRKLSSPRSSDKPAPAGGPPTRQSRPPSKCRAAAIKKTTSLPAAIKLGTPTLPRPSSLILIAASFSSRSSRHTFRRRTIDRPDEPPIRLAIFRA